MWFNPSLFPASEDEQLKKINLVAGVFTNIGLPIFDEEMLNITVKYFKSL